MVKLGLRTGATVLLGLLLASIALGLALADGPRRHPPHPARHPGTGGEGRSHGSASTAEHSGPTIPRDLLLGLDPLHTRSDGDGLVADLAGGKVARLTLDPGLQAHVAHVLRMYEVPYGALVAIEPRTGRVLAYVSHSSANPEAGDLARDPTPPAASVFKIVTGSALVDGGFGPTTRVCYGGGMSRLGARDIENDPARDRQCATLAEAMGGSINAVFAKLADQHVAHDVLSRYAAAFGFGQALPFDVPTRASPAEVPDDRLEFARTAAGFWHMHMSPLHAALIASTIANDGTMPRAWMVDRVEDAHAHVLGRGRAQPFRDAIPAATAQAVNTMMQRTITDGTAHHYFYDEHGTPFLPGIRVAGKTGTLSAEHPYRGYSWWVGFAPADHPTIAVAALVVNTPQWRIKASFLAREALRYRLVEEVAPHAHH